MIYYPVPVHRLKLYLESHSAVSCPITEQATSEVLSLPIWPELDTSRVVAQILRAGVSA